MEKNIVEIKEVRKIKEIEFTSSIRNNLIKERRLALGLYQDELGKIVGVSGCYISAIERFAIPKKETQLKLAKFFNCSVDDLFKPWFNLVKETSKTILVNQKELSKLAQQKYIERRDIVEDPDKKIEEVFIANEFKKLLSTLTTAEAKAITLHYGLNQGSERTLREVGEIMKITPERVRQIILKGIRKLGHPTRSRYLRHIFYGEKLKR